VKWLQVVNWERFQNYKHRHPPWIKFYRSLLDDRNFAKLPDASKLHLLLLWLVASRKADGCFEADEEWLSGEIKTQTPVNLDVLIKAGFLRYAKRDPRGKPKPMTADPGIEDLDSTKAEMKAAIKSMPAVCPPDLADLTLYNNLDQYKDKKGKLTSRGTRLRKLWADWDDVLETWTQAYPALDIMAEVRSAHAWELENPANRKVDRRRYLGAWLRRAQDRGRSAGGTGSTGDPVSIAKLALERHKEREGKT